MGGRPPDPVGEIPPPGISVHSPVWSANLLYVRPGSERKGATVPPEGSERE